MLENKESPPSIGQSDGIYSPGTIQMCNKFMSSTKVIGDVETVTKRMHAQAL